MEDCDKPVRARGWCSTHYARWQRRGSPEVTLLPGRTCLPGCECERHRPGPGSKPCPPGCTCGVHFKAGTPCPPECGCNRHGEWAAGVRKHPHYSRWMNMISRCTNPRNKQYKDYGGRGIGICREWQNPWLFFHYLSEVLGPCPPGHSLDRIDNNGNYEPGNIRWASRSTQARNKRPRHSLKLTCSGPKAWVIS